MITNQAKRAIGCMRAAGYRRGEFRVQTERKVTRRDYRRCVEYGDAKIFVDGATRERQMKLVDAVLDAGVNVTVTIMPDGRWGYPTYELAPAGYLGRLGVIDLRQPATSNFFFTYARRMADVKI